MKVGIIGAGVIASKMATAINNLEDFEAYAIASRDINKANEFKNKHKFTKAYGSYEELVKDEQVDLVYVATPHNFHFEHAKLCLENKKAVLVEKPFTVNSKEANKLFELSKKNNVFICEAMWTRFMPSRFILEELLKEDMIGEIHQLSADLSYEMKNKERIVKKELAGGALLDIGIYPLSFALTYLGYNYNKVDGVCTYYKDTGVDANDTIYLEYEDKTATITSSMQVSSTRTGFIYGEKGTIVVDHIGNIDGIKVYDNGDNLIKTISIPDQINGYEYELISCKKAILNNQIETIEHSHKDTLVVMKIMDDLRNKWNIKYPFE